MLPDQILQTLVTKMGDRCHPAEGDIVINRVEFAGIVATQQAPA